MNLPNPQPVLDPSEAFRRSKTMFAAQSLWHRLGGAVPLDRGGRPAGQGAGRDRGRPPHIAPQNAGYLSQADTPQAGLRGKLRLDCHSHH
jgi:hypothetical protein